MKPMKLIYSTRIDFFTSRTISEPNFWEFFWNFLEPKRLCFFPKKKFRSVRKSSVRFEFGSIWFGSVRQKVRFVKKSMRVLYFNQANEIIKKDQIWNLILINFNVEKRQTKFCLIPT